MMRLFPVLLLASLCSGMIPSFAWATGSIYWTNTRTIQRANLDGTARETLLSVGASEAGPFGLALDIPCGKMYWTTATNQDTIRRADLDGARAELLLNVGPSPINLALDLPRRTLYWTDASTNEISRAALNGTGARGILSSNFPEGIAIDSAAGHLYWSALYTTGIHRANLDGSRVIDLVLGLDDPSALALDLQAGMMYWTETNRGVIARAHLDGTRVQTLLTGLANPNGLALDLRAGHLYWSDAHTISRADLTGAHVQVILPGLDHPLSLALAVEDILPVPVLTVSPASVDFDSVSLSAGRPVQTVILTNHSAGTAPLCIHDLRLASAMPFTVHNDTCTNQMLPSLLSCTFDVRLATTTAGDFRDTVTIATNATTPSLTIPLRGVVRGTRLTVQPQSFNFGNMAVGMASPPQVFTVAHTGNIALTLGRLALTGATSAFTLENDTCSQGQLAPGTSCTIAARFVPPTAGPAQATIEIPALAAANQPGRIPLVGTGGAGVIRTTPQSHDFGAVALHATAGPLVVLVTNSGTEPLAVGLLTLEGKDFTLQNDHCSHTRVPAGLSCTVEVLFSPQSPGILTAALVIPSDDPVTPTTQVLLSGGMPVPTDQLDVFENEDTKIASVPANENAIVSTADGVVVLIPVGALKSNDRLTIQKLAPTALPGTPPGTVAGLVVNITLASEQTTFPIPLTIRLPYSVDGTNLMWFFDTSASKWVQIPNTQVSPNEKVVVGQVAHLTIFGVFQASTTGPTAPTSAPAPGGSGGGSGGGGCSLMPTRPVTLSHLLEGLGNLLLPVLVMMGVWVWHWRRHPQ